MTDSKKHDRNRVFIKIISALSNL